MKYLLLLVFTMTFMTSLSGQSNDNVILKSFIKDKKNNIALPYATVFNLNKKFGTAADLNGDFTLPNNSLGDSIKISYIGFKNEIVVIDKNSPSIIYLSPESNLLDEIVIRSEDEYLYRLVSKIKKNKKTDYRESKSYLFLETTSQGKTIELLEGYFNGSFQDGICSNLKLKKGRIGIKPLGNRYFMSTESSKLFSLHNHFIEHKVLPHNPLEYTKRKLRKKYILTLVRIFKEGENTFYDITFEPRRDDATSFSGHLILDINSNTLKQIEFEITNSVVHPFIPFGGISIEDVNLKINKTFYIENGKSYVDGINFNYTLTYIDKDQNKVNTISEVFIKTYNQTEIFNLPLYKFSLCDHKDYRDITIGNYDSLFWQKNNEFRFYKKKQYINKFVQGNYIENNFAVKESDKGQLEFNYELWNRKRILMRETPRVNNSFRRVQRNFRVSRVNSINNKFNLNVKLYLDIVKLEGNYKYEIYATIDPINTFFYSKITDLEHAFINMYFDLMEIEKRELELKLKEIDLSNFNLVSDLYKKAVKNFDTRTTQFCRDVDEGQDFEQMKKWNNIISGSINIDNLEVFGFKAKAN